jgi:hypothetical protein
MTSDDLTAFITARLDEDEAAARESHHEGQRWLTEEEDVYRWPDDELVHSADRKADARHIARHDPARALREVAAKRAILGMHHPTEPYSESGFTYPAAARFCGWCGPGDSWQAEQEPDSFPFALWPCTHARILAAIWSDHADFRPEWAVSVPVQPR